MELGVGIYVREAVELNNPTQYLSPTSDQCNQKLWGRVQGQMRWTVLRNSDVWPGLRMADQVSLWWAADAVEVVEAGEDGLWDGREMGGRCNGEAHWRLLSIGSSMIFL